MDHDDIQRVQREYVAAARRAIQAGFDIVNVMGAELVALPMTFLMSRYNRRTDEYGGSFENRARFWLETLEQVRAAVDGKCAVTARLCIDTLDGGDDGMRADHEAAGFVAMADHLVDFWDVMVGGEGNTWGKDLGPSRFYAENFQGEYVRRLRPHTGQAARRRRPLHQSGHDGPGDSQRSAGHHRIGSLLDLRPVSAAEDRRGTDR